MDYKVGDKVKFLMRGRCYTQVETGKIVKIEKVLFWTNCFIAKRNEYVETVDIKDVIELIEREPVKPLSPKPPLHGSSIK